MNKILMIISFLILLFVYNCATGYVKVGDIAKIKVMPEVLKVKVGKSIEMKAVGFTKDGKEIEIYPVWEVHEKDVKIGILSKTTGDKVKFIGKSAGIARVIVTTGNIARQVKITVEK
ncbi:MAG: hypothetical protein N3E50_06805 [Candidatus Goldbacteria bacterium]|nr:hypothetical protein [Candidatus Goldiibacteriota bacterium]